MKLWQTSTADRKHLPNASALTLFYWQEVSRWSGDKMSFSAALTWELGVSLYFSMFKWYSVFQLFICPPAPSLTSPPLSLSLTLTCHSCATRNRINMLLYKAVCGFLEPILWSRTAKPLRNWTLTPPNLILNVDLNRETVYFNVWDWPLVLHSSICVFVVQFQIYQRKWRSSKDGEVGEGSGKNMLLLLFFMEKHKKKTDQKMSLKIPIYPQCTFSLRIRDKKFSHLC